MEGVTPTDMMRSRLVGNQVRMIQEHLEAMQRDMHGLEFDPWKKEVDNLWRRTFEQINRMGQTTQQSALEGIKELWMTYITHYGVIGDASA